MENTPRLYDTLIQVLGQHANWVDLRHLKTLAWMMVGLIPSGGITLPAWAPYVVSRAQQSQSTVRRFRRWLDNDKIAVFSLYGPLMQHALTQWGEHGLQVALETSLWWKTSCRIRLAVRQRGRAIPLVWLGLEHGRAQGGYDASKALLDKAATLLPVPCTVVLLADRGFADTALMAQLQRLGWPGRIRIKASGGLYRRGRPPCKVERLAVARGDAGCWQRGAITEKRYGPVPLAVARPHGGTDGWQVISDEPTASKTCAEYGVRVDIEENFWDEKSNGFHLESSLLRGAAALSRLCLGVAIAPLSLVAQGSAVVKNGKRRLGDPHWFRGSSDLKMGWNGVKLARTRGYALITHVSLAGAGDPAPARASKCHNQHDCQRRFAFEISEAA